MRCCSYACLLTELATTALNRDSTYRRWRALLLFFYLKLDRFFIDFHKLSHCFWRGKSVVWGTLINCDKRTLLFSGFIKVLCHFILNDQNWAFLALASTNNIIGSKVSGCLFIIGLRLWGLTEDKVAFRWSALGLVALNRVNIHAIVDWHIRLKAIICATNIVRLLLNSTIGLHATKCCLLLLLLLLISSNRVRCFTFLQWQFLLCSLQDSRAYAWTLFRDLIFDLLLWLIPRIRLQAIVNLLNLYLLLLSYHF